MQRSVWVCGALRWLTLQSDCASNPSKLFFMTMLAVIDGMNQLMHQCAEYLYAVIDCR